MGTGMEGFLMGRECKKAGSIYHDLSCIDEFLQGILRLNL